MTETTALDAAAVATVANTRVRSLLELAGKYGYEIRPSVAAENCWVVGPVDMGAVVSLGRQLVVYGEARHTCHVYLDDPGNGFDRIAQKHARLLITERLI